MSDLHEQVTEVSERSDGLSDQDSIALAPASGVLPELARSNSKAEALTAMVLELRSEESHGDPHQLTKLQSINNSPAMNRELHRLPEGISRIEALRLTEMEQRREGVAREARHVDLQNALSSGPENFFERMEDCVDHDRERDENAGFLESSQSAMQIQARQVDEVNLNSLLLNEQLLLRGLSITAMRRRRRGGYALAIRSGRIADLLCAEEADACEELMKSIYGEGAGGLQQTFAALVNLARQVANALKGELPLDIYAGQNTEDFRRLISIIAEKRCQLLKEIFAEPLGEGSEQLHELLCDQVKQNLVQHVAIRTAD